jgi:starvation-inducible DNA-binding protein
MKPNIGIAEKNQKGSITLLNTCLADAVILYTKLRKYHWNVKGDNFMELHKLFESHYDQVAEAIDEIAERVSQLGGMAIGTTVEFAKHSSLKEAPGKNPANNMDMVKELLEDHETVIRSLREGIDKADEENKDAGTADFITGLMQGHEKRAWKPRRYIK